MAEILPKPAPTICTFPDFLFCAFGYKWDPAKWETENHQKNKDHPAGFRHLFFDNGHAFVIAKGTFQGHVGLIYGLHTAKIINFRGRNNRITGEDCKPGED